MTNQKVTIDVSRIADVQPEVLFDLLDDASGWPEWSVIGSVEFAQPGDEAAQVVGAQRVFKTGLLKLSERILVREPNQRIDYALLSGLPLDDYVGRIEFKPFEAGTQLNWSASFRIPHVGTGWFWKLAIKAILLNISRAAVRRVEAVQRKTED